MKILIFGGTTEGRKAAYQLMALGHEITVSVATAYGASLLPKEDNLKIHVGRLDKDAMVNFLQEGSYDVVIDATHPYAVLVTENICWACKERKVLCVRLKRSKSDYQCKDWLLVADAKVAVKLLMERTSLKNILLTTGTKDLMTFMPLNRQECKVFARVLPTIESIEACLQAGLPPAQIIGIQGPCSVELNRAMLEQFNISVLITKESGNIGGFWEKVEAANDLGIELLVIKRPEETDGYDMEELLQQVWQMESTRLQEGVEKGCQ